MAGKLGNSNKIMNLIFAKHLALGHVLGVLLDDAKNFKFFLKKFCEKMAGKLENSNVIMNLILPSILHSAMYLPL
jgi:hypothetical protein